ncbi:MAG: hypothetical protein R3F13_06905 [Prosthecobacter sp.]
MLTSTSNERDRPSLALPRIQAVSDVLAAFGWRGARQDPTSRRDAESNVLQPAIIGNGTLGVWLTRLSEDHGITEPRAGGSVPGGSSTGSLKLLTRHPSEQERELYEKHLGPGYEARVKSRAIPAAAPTTGVRE